MGNALSAWPFTTHRPTRGRAEGVRTPAARDSPVPHSDVQPPQQMSHRLGTPRAEPRGAKLHNGEQEKRASGSSEPCSQHQTSQR